MAFSSSSSSYFSSSSSSSWNSTVSQEEFKLYHTIDRNIFARLILNLGRDPGESMQVMALLLWLEKSNKNARNLIYYVQNWPDSLISALADEAVQCLKCTRSEEYPFVSHINGDNYSIIPLIQKVTKNEISLRYIHDHRLDIVCGIVRLVQDVCVRAFDDIIMQQVVVAAAAASGGGGDHQERKIEQNLDTLRFYGPLIRPVLPLYNYHNSGVGEFVGDDHHRRGNNDQQVIVRPNTDNHTDDSSSFSNEIDDVLKRIQVVSINSMELNDNDKNKEVATDDRTIFLTFSKGYPISENEVTEFFTRKFGENLIEVLEMQEVAAAGEQPLYARLIMKSASGLEKVLKGKPKVKFTINGKHVWSRKFVPRNIKSSFESDHLP